MLISFDGRRCITILLIEFLNLAYICFCISALDREFDFIVKNVHIRQWRSLARHLDVSDTDIDCVEEKYRGNVREQLRHVLVLWAERLGHDASRDKLVAALRLCQFNATANELQKL